MNDIRMTFGEHLEELRRRILYALVGIAVGVTLCGIFYEPITREMLRPYYNASCAAQPDSEAPPTPIQNPGPPTLFVILVKMCLILGIIVASPWALYQIWQFVASGLYPHERRLVYVYGPVSFLLFIGGASFFFFFLLPLVLQFLMAIGTGIEIDSHLMIENRYLLNNYFSFVSWMTLVFGLAFETPLVVMFLARTGIVPLEQLKRGRRFVILGAVIIAAILTPPDVFSQVALAIPLIALYELGLLLARLGRRPASRTEGFLDDPSTKE